MKLLLLSIASLLSVQVAKCQFSPTQFAQKIAQKMHDTLALTDAQKQQVYNANLQLHQQKMDVRQKYKMDSVRFYVQKTENTRDSLYHIFLSDDKYSLYKQKKVRLINND